MRSALQRTRTAYKVAIQKQYSHPPLFLPSVSNATSRMASDTGPIVFITGCTCGGILHCRLAPHLFRFQTHDDPRVGTLAGRGCTVYASIRGDYHAKESTTVEVAANEESSFVGYQMSSRDSGTLPDRASSNPIRLTQITPIMCIDAEDHI